MGIEDKLRAKQQEVESQRDQKRQQEEQEKFAPLRQQIKGLHQKREHLESLFAKLNQGYKEATASLTRFKETKAPLDDLYVKYEDILKEVGTETKADFIQSDEYADEPEVQGYKAAGQGMREKVGGLSQTKAELREEISDLDFRGGRSPLQQAERGKQAQTRRDLAFETIKNRIAEVQAEIDELYEKTPEGQAAKLEKGKQKILVRLENRTGLRDVSSIPDLVEQDDLEDANEYGEEMVKGLILENSFQRAEKGIDAERRRAGLDKLTQDIRAITEIPEKVDQVRVAIREAEIERAKAVQQLDELFRDNPRALERLLQYSGQVWRREEAAGGYINHRLGMVDGYHHNEQETTPGWVSNLLERSQPAIDALKKGGLRGINDWREGGGFSDSPNVDTKLPNMDFILEYLGRIREFYKNFSVFAKENIHDLPIHLPKEKEKELLPKDRNHDKNYQYRDYNSWKEHIFIHKKTLDVLKKDGFGNTSEFLQRTEAAWADNAAKIKERIPAKIELDWRKARFIQFQRENPNAQGADYKLSQLERIKTNATQALKLAQRTRIDLAGSLNETIGIHKSTYQFSEKPYSMLTGEAGSLIHQWHAPQILDTQSLSV